MATDFSHMTVAQLRQELKRRQLVQTGVKADLINRLVAFENEQQQDDEHTDQTNREAADGDAPTPDASNRDNADGAQPADPAEPEPVSAETPIPDQEATAPPAIAEELETPQPELVASPLPESAETTNSLLTNPTDLEMSVSDPLPSVVLPEEANSLATSEPIESMPIPEAIPVTELVQDIASRKRRSRSPPPPGEESIAKRARADRESKSPAPQPKNHQSYQELPDPDTMEQTVPETTPHPEDHSRQERDWAQRLEGNQPKREEVVPMDIDEPLDEFGRVERSRHPATSALYIANLMRPLKDNDFRDHIIKIAAFPGVDSNPECVLDFYLDSIKTHAFVGFNSVAAASRVRTALHGKIYPNERIRKALWVDFIPPHHIQEWVREERTDRGRWIVTYEGDINGGGEGDVKVSHVKDTDMGKSNQVQRSTNAPPPVPSALSRDFTGAREPQPRVRGRGGRGFRLEQEGGEWKTTTTGPSLTYKPVSEELAQRRIDNMRSYYTTNRHRDMGRDDEINRYTFEAADRFVDRGKEVFIGIRPPHRQAERDRLAGAGGKRRRRHRSPRRRDDRYYGGGRREHDHYGGQDRYDDRQQDRRGSQDSRHDDRHDDRKDDRQDDRRDDFKDDRRDDLKDDRRSDFRDDRDRFEDDWPRKDNGNDRLDRYDDRRGGRDRSPINDIPRSRFDGAPLPTYEPPKGRSGRRRHNRR
ncbi:hypothetical protein QBC38DRAFT_241667 [Podospora fimiseda]|uniref:SAP domain-containing protein n=1 Tax=Podospora fimiseda TaxID=252190 RepID=A0AAN7H3M9_9PEZI|nr:hypothetical protein QBC38DRAFT_241667 [Podospora fimiseda]